MALNSPLELVVLHGVRLKPFASVKGLAELHHLDASDVQATLDDVAAREWARFREGVVTGWSLTPAGRAEAGRQVLEELWDRPERAVVEEAYRRFLEHNQAFLQVCTDWQLRTLGGTPTPNDHADAAYDRGVIERLRTIDTAIRPVCAHLGTSLHRFSHYGPRFGAALRRVDAGELEWFTKPVLDSYHTVWFELHEDLLATLGRERATEGVSPI